MGGVAMSTDDRMSKPKKIRVSAIACIISSIIALVATGTLFDKVLWFVELSGFALIVIWTIW